MPTTPSSNPRRSADYISLREYVDTRLDATELSNKLLHEALEQRLKSLNEFRGHLQDQNAMFLTKSEYCVFKERLDEDIRFLRETNAKLEGKADQSRVNTVYLISVVGLIISLIGLMMRLIGV